MKKSNKLVAAGVGLLVAGTMSLVPALASEGTDPTASDPAAEAIIPTVSVEAPAQEETQKTPPLGEGESTAAQPTTGPGLLNEAATETGAPIEAVDGSAQQEAAPQETAAAQTETTQAPVSSGKGAAQSVQVAPEAQAETTTQGGEATAAESTAATDATEAGQPTAEAAAESETAEAQVETVNTEVFSEIKPEDVVYAIPVQATRPVAVSVTLVGTQSTTQVPAETRAPLLSATSDVPEAQGVALGAPGEATANGQSMVVWFELPPAEGPALQPGAATQPLLGEAVSESATATSAVITAEVAKATPAVTNAVAAAKAPQAAQNNVIEKGLARTGSVAQYAALLSAVAMVIGAGMLIGAAAARRKYVR